jgi:hypothetical protein
MIDVVVTISPGLLALPDALEAAIEAGQRDAGDLLVERFRESMKAVGANATGATAEGIAVAESGFEKTTIVAPAPSRVIEEGRPAGKKVPQWSVFEPILQKWAKAKGLQIDNLYPIAVKIRRDGYPARFPFKRALEGSGGEVKAVFVRAVEKGLS